MNIKHYKTGSIIFAQYRCRIPPPSPLSDLVDCVLFFKQNFQHKYWLVYIIYHHQTEYFRNICGRYINEWMAWLKLMPHHHWRSLFYYTIYLYAVAFSFRSSLKVIINFHVSYFMLSVMCVRRQYQHRHLHILTTCTYHSQYVATIVSIFFKPFTFKAALKICFFFFFWVLQFCVCGFHFGGFVSSNIDECQASAGSYHVMAVVSPSFCEPSNLL